jgi:hypothetical protein
VRLKMVYLDQGNSGGQGKALCKGGPHQKGAEKSGTTGKGNGRQFSLADSGIPQGYIHHRNNILLMRPGGQFRNNAPITPREPADRPNYWTIRWYCSITDAEVSSQEDSMPRIYTGLSGLFLILSVVT